MALGCARDHDELSRARDNYISALCDTVNKVARQAARTTLLLAAERCGYEGSSDLLTWASGRVNSYRRSLSA